MHYSDLPSILWDQMQLDRVDVAPDKWSCVATSSPGSKLIVRPVTIKAAMEFVDKHHRHHRRPQGGLFAVGCAFYDDPDAICGVAIVGRPVARLACDGWTAEVTRLCTLGQRNACSLLYGAAWRAARALGYTKLITYILVSENGASLRASGATLLGEAGGGKWGRSKRPREDSHPTCRKLKWVFQTVEAPNSPKRS